MCTDGFGFGGHEGPDMDKDFLILVNDDMEASEDTLAQAIKTAAEYAGDGDKVEIYKRVRRGKCKNSVEWE